MRRTQGRLEALELLPDGRRALRVSCSPQAVPRPGQAVLALQPGQQEPRRRVLFPIEIGARAFLAPMPQKVSWQPGDELDLLGPVGRGFAPPSRARRWLLLGLADAVDALRPLVDQGLQAGASIALWAERAPADLPAQVEVRPALGEALAWADYIAVALPAASLADLRQHLGTQDEIRRLGSAQVLVLTDMLCGYGGCGACATPPSRGWALACTAGPVFGLEDLSW